MATCFLSTAGNEAAAFNVSVISARICLTGGNIMDSGGI